MFDSIHNFLDEYVRVGHGQNNNIPCPFCKSSLGHYASCQLLTGVIAKPHSDVAELDKLFALQDNR